MPRYLDGHPLGDVHEKELQLAQSLPEDEFGVVHVNIHYNKEEDRCYCLLEAPDKESVKKHHEKVGIDCEFIVEVNSTGV